MDTVNLFLKLWKGTNIYLLFYLRRPHSGADISLYFWHYSVGHKMKIPQIFACLLVIITTSIFVLLKKIFLIWTPYFLHTVIRNSVIHFIFWYHGQIWIVITFKWVIWHMLRGLLTTFASETTEPFKPNLTKMVFRWSPLKFVSDNLSVIQVGWRYKKHSFGE